ncbi:MAG TPA: thioesterase family protein [Pseudonocardiaceae bacterium]
MDLTTARKALLESASTVTLRPRYEGNNICTWIGFKHVNYLVEEAVLDHFRSAGLSTRRLFEEFGLGLDIVGIDSRILNAFHLDDAATAEVNPAAVRDGVLTFKVTMSKEGSSGKDVTSTVKVRLRRETYVDSTNDVPEELAPYAVDHIGGSEPSEPGDAVTVADNTALSQGRGTTGADPVLAHLIGDSNAVGWKWRIPYPYCHYNERLQMSGYLRQMEEVVDLFLAERGISIKTLLDDRRWIPVVPHSKITMLDEVYMEEDLYTVYTVEHIFKDFTYQSRMDGYVVRDGRLVHTATGTITHGYAVIENRRDWSLVNFDERVLAALRGETKG